MNTQQAILEVIQHTGEFKVGEWQVVHLQENAYRLSSPGIEYFVKWIAEEDACGKNEVRFNQEVLAKGRLPVPRLLHVLEGNGGRAACWEWIEGLDLRRQSRHLLAQAFRELGYFHAEQRHNSAVASPTTRQSFATINELLQAELDILCTGLDGPTRSRCQTYFDLLSEHGYATLIHGDMHPGNLRLGQRGLVFVDWGFALPSLNLFDLDYIQSVDLEGEMKWWDVTPAEAQAVLPAYCQGSGLDVAAIWAAHRAVMVWAQLNSRYNALRNRNEAGAKRCVENLSRLS